MPKLILNGKEYANNKPDGYPPIIYSDEEREVGVWRDGKPLYEKTINLPNTIIITANIWNTIYDVSTLNIDTLVYGVVNPNSSQFGDMGFYKNGNDLQVLFYQQWNVKIFTIRYTKTTDVAGSGKWTTYGEFTHHYSTDEQVIGTWIDGKTLYEKTLKIYNDVAIANGTSFTTGITNPDFVMVKEAYYSDTSNNAIGMLPYYQNDGSDSIQSIRWNSSDNKLYVKTTSNFNINAARFLIVVLQYTKQ